MIKITVVKFEEFLHELEKEYTYHQAGGTSYRTKTAEYSLIIAKRAGEITPFFDRDVTKQLVSDLFPSLDYHHNEDVANMLFTICNDLNLKSIQTKQCLDYVKQIHHIPY